MISLVVCSRYPDISEELKQNIIHTIGCEYELIVIDNSQNNYSIFSAYNEGVRRAQGDVICFMHEDVLFESVDWGQKVDTLFQSDNSIGACAVAGCRYLRKAPSYYPIGEGYNAINLIQSDKTDSAPYKWEDYSTVLDLAVFDGLWFCIRRSLFQQISFDDHSFSGFHFYDIDISVQVQQAGYRVVTIPDVWIKHLSGGNVNSTWVKNAFLFHDKWKDVLPISHLDVSTEEAYKLECKALYSLLRSCIMMRLWKLALRWFIVTYNVLGIKGFYYIFANH